MLKIRMSRFGKKKQPTYRIIVSDSSKDPWGTYLENLGYYNPKTKEKTLEADRIKYWLSKGAQLSATLHNLFVDEKIIETEKVKASKGKKKKSEATETEEKKPEEGKQEAPAKEEKEEKPAQPAKKEAEKPQEAKPEQPKEAEKPKDLPADLSSEALAKEKALAKAEEKPS